MGTEVVVDIHGHLHAGVVSHWEKDRSGHTWSYYVEFHEPYMEYSGWYVGINSGSLRTGLLEMFSLPS